MRILRGYPQQYPYQYGVPYPLLPYWCPKSKDLSDSDSLSIFMKINTNN